MSIWSYSWEVDFFGPHDLANQKENLPSTPHLGLLPAILLSLSVGARTCPKIHLRIFEHRAAQTSTSRFQAIYLQVTPTLHGVTPEKKRGLIL